MPTTIQMIGTLLFACAIVHTFITPFFERIAMNHPKHAGFWHLLGEIEVVFGFWAFIIWINAISLSRCLYLP